MVMFYIKVSFVNIISSAFIIILKLISIFTKTFLKQKYQLTVTALWTNITEQQTIVFLLTNITKINILL